MADLPGLHAMVLAFLASAGCVGDPSPTWVDPVCEPRYPDGTPKDCTLDIAVGVGAVPAGWTCIHRLESDEDGWTLRYDLLRNGGEFGVLVSGHGSRPADVVVARIGVQGDGGGVPPLAVSTLSDGFAPLGASDLDSGTWTVWTTAFTTQGAEVRTTMWNGTAWFVYAATDGSWAADGMVQAQTPDGPGPYVPVPVTMHGQEGEPTIKPQPLLGKTGSFGALAPGLFVPCG